MAVLYYTSQKEDGLHGTSYTPLFSGGGPGREYYKSGRDPASDPANLSRQILDLERELGVTLMLRGKNGLTLTDDGIFFRQRAQEIVELADRLEKDFAGRQNDISGMVDIGASEVAGSQTLAKLIQRVLRKISRGAVHPFTTKRWTYQRPSGERGWWTSACCWNPSM